MSTLGPAASPAPTVRAGIYCRISRDKVGAGLGVERQRRECQELADKLGWSVSGTYSDNDISAYSGKRRPEYERLLEELRAGRITGVLCWHLDRLNRSPTELERLLDVLDRNHVSVQTVTAGFIDLTTASGRAVARTLGAWSRFESEHKSERLRAKHLELARAGAVHHLGGRRAFGYEVDGVTIVPAEAATLREMMRRLLRDRQSTGQIARWLNDEGITGTEGGAWRALEVHRILTAARPAGWRTEPCHPGERPRPQLFLARGKWPAILTRAQVEQARVLLADDTTRPGSQYRYLLSQMLYCGRCEQLLSPQRTAGQLIRWHCVMSSHLARPVRCSSLSIRSAELETALIDALDGAVQSGIVGRILDSGDPREPLATAATELLHQAARVKLDYREGRLDRSDWQRLSRMTAQRLARAEANAATALDAGNLAALARAPSSFRRRWARSDLGTRRAIIRALTAKITVRPAGKGRSVAAAQRLVIEWRPNNPL